MRKLPRIRIDTRNNANEMMQMSEEKCIGSYCWQIVVEEGTLLKFGKIIRKSLLVLNTFSMNK